MERKCRQYLTLETRKRRESLWLVVCKFWMDVMCTKLYLWAQVYGEPSTCCLSNHHYYKFRYLPWVILPWTKFYLFPSYSYGVYNFPSCNTWDTGQSIYQGITCLSNMLNLLLKWVAEWTSWLSISEYCR